MLLSFVKRSVVHIQGVSKKGPHFGFWNFSAFKTAMITVKYRPHFGFWNFSAFKTAMITVK